MSSELQQAINDFNRIPHIDNSKRIIIATLKPAQCDISHNNPKE